MTELTVSAERERREAVLRRLDRAIILGNGVAAVLANVYFILIDFPITLGKMVNLSINLAIVFLILVVSYAIGKKSLPSWESWYLDVEVDHPPGRDIRKAAIEIPITMARRSFVIWLCIGIAYGVFGLLAIWGDSLLGLQVFLSNLLGVGFIAGTTAALVVLFAMERVWQPEMHIFFPEGRVDSVGAFRLTLRRRVLFLFFIMMVPLVLLAAAAYAYTVQMTSAPLPGLLVLEFFVVSLGFILVITLTRTLGHSLVQSVERLQAMVQRVGEGDLDTHLRVMANDEFGDLTRGLNSMVDALRQEETIRQLFSLYVTPEVAEHAIAHGASLGGQLTEATVLFSDIRSFTTMTEQLGADAIIALLNRYFDRMSDAVTQHGGLVNKFGGDSLLAVFGTPLNPHPDHATHAVRAAQTMLRALDAFNAEQDERGEPNLHIGVGIATGSLVAGNVGSEDRLEYTVIGDTVNLASRLETMTKALGVPILLSASTADNLSEALTLRPMGDIEVRGKQALVLVYGLASNSTGKGDDGPAR